MNFFPRGRTSRTRFSTATELRAIFRDFRDFSRFESSEKFASPGDKVRRDDKVPRSDIAAARFIRANKSPAFI